MQRNGLFLQETMPEPINAVPFLFFFDTVAFLRPFAIDELQGNAFIAAELLTPQIPVPCPEDIDTFRKLVRNMSGEAAAYYHGYLSSLSQRARTDPDEISVQSLITALAPESKKENNSVLEARLWQAKMLLALAENLSRDEREMNTRLARISAKNSAIFRQIKGEGEAAPDSDSDSDLDEQTIPGSLPLSSSRQQQLLQAWCRLYLNDHNPRPGMLCTDSADLTGTLFDICEKISGSLPRKMFRLQLPSLPKESEAIHRIKEFQRLSSACRQELFGHLQTAWQEKSETSLQPAAKSIENWQKIVEKWRTPDRPGHYLDFFLCRNVSAPRLFRRLCSSEKQHPADPRENRQAIFVISGRD